MPPYGLFFLSIHRCATSTIRRYATAAAMTVPAPSPAHAPLRLPSDPGARVVVGDPDARLHAASQIILALLQKRAEADKAAEAEGKKVYAHGLSSQDLWKLSEEEFPEKPFPIPPPRPVRKGKKGRIIENPPEQPRPGHAINSMKYLKLTVLPAMTHRNLIRKVHAQRPPSDELERTRLFAKEKKLKRRAELLGKAAPTAEDAAAAVAKVTAESMVDVWRWQLVPEEERQEMRERAERKRTEREAKMDARRDDGRLEVAPYGPGRLDHLNERRKRARLDEEEQIREMVRAQAAKRPGEVVVQSAAAGVGRWTIDGDSGRRGVFSAPGGVLSIADKLRVGRVPPGKMQQSWVGRGKAKKERR